MIVKMFKAKKQTNRFNKNQKVWVTKERGNHACIRFKFRGKGRYVSGVIDKWNLTNRTIWNTVIGEDGFNEIEVSDEFAKRLGVYAT